MDKIMEAIKRLLKSRNLKYGTNAVVLIAAVAAIAVIVNLLVGMTDIKWDLTPNKLYSIGDTTKDILKSLNKDVTIYGLFDDGKIGGGDEYKEVTELLSQYEKYPRIKVEYVDPDKNPGIIKELDPDNVKELRKNDFVVKSGNKIKKLEYYDLFTTEFNQQTFSQYKTGSTAEQGFTGAIKYVTSDKTPTIYFTEGHEENKVDNDYRKVKEILERNNYDVKTLNLLASEKVPEDAEILVVASPKKDLSFDESDKIKEYFKNGGRAIFLFDSLESNPSFAEFEKLLADYNVSLNYDRVKENDSKRHVPNRNFDIVPDLQSNSINSNLDPGNFVMIMPKSRSINILKNQKEYVTVTSLMKTSSKAEGEQIDKSMGANNIGPLDLAVAVEYKGGAKPVKVLVMGNGSFMSDNAIEQYQQYSINGLYFFLNSLSWMQDKKDEVLIAPKTYDTPRLSINALQANIMGLVVVILLPLIILASGAFVYLRRRHL